MVKLLCFKEDNDIFKESEDNRKIGLVAKEQNDFSRERTLLHDANSILIREPFFTSDPKLSREDNRMN